MALLPESEIEKLKTDVSLLSLVRDQGYQPSKQGKDYAICCPFHEGDDTPSLIISSNNLFHCFGCDAGGSVIDWIMKTQGVSFRHAVELLRNDLPSLTAPTQLAKKSTTQKLDVLLSEDDESQQLLNQVIDYYHETLKQSPDALSYLESRGLGNAELIDRFKIGYANRTLGYRLPHKNRKAGRMLRGTLQEIGILRSSGHEHFSGSIVVPILNRDGNTVEVYGRKVLGKRLRKGTPQHLYLPGPHLDVWNASGLQDQKEIILCEALLDAMTLWVNGYRNVTASYGASGFTDDHLRLFKEYGTRRVLIAYDRDEAGNTAAEQLSKQLQKVGLDCYRIELPKNMDVNEYALQVTPANKSLGLVIRKAVWMGSGKPPKRECTDPVIDESENMDQAILPLAAELSDPEILPPAEALPETPANDVEANISDKEIQLMFGTRKYRIRGLEKNKNYELLKVNVLVSCEDQLHVDTFDLYAAKHRQAFIKVASLELSIEENVLKKDLGKVLLKLEELQEQLISGHPSETDQPSVLTDDDRDQALELLRDPDLLDRVLSDFSRCGIVGEEVNKLVCYLAAGSRKLDRPLAVLIQSTSAAGKSVLMDAVLNMMPESERVQYSAMTGQSLFYMGETNLKNKILAIAEEEGASNASYALKLLQSEGEITIASTGKDESTGNLVTKEYKVEGPVMLFLTTTAIDIDEELLNRCLVLTVNESRAQTKAIHEAQRKRRTLDGLQAQIEKDHLIKLHRNAQGLLKPLRVVNPYADQLTFLDDKTRTRRDHEKYLTLIDSIALLHQYQRPIENINYAGKNIEYVEVELSDIETANRLAHEVLGRTLDELPTQTRKLLKAIQKMVESGCQKDDVEKSDYRFSRRAVRDVTGWGNTQLKIHLKRLEEMEYLLIHRGRRGQSYEYELLYDQDGSDDQPHLIGLIDLEKLQYDEKKSGVKENKSAPGRGQVGGRSGPVKPMKPNSSNGSKESQSEIPKSTSGIKNNGASHHSVAAV